MAKPTIRVRPLKLQNSVSGIVDPNAVPVAVNPDTEIGQFAGVEFNAPSAVGDGVVMVWRDMNKLHLSDVDVPDLVLKDIVQTSQGIYTNTGSGLTGGGNLTSDLYLSIIWGGNGAANSAARSDHFHTYLTNDLNTLTRLWTGANHNEYTSEAAAGSTAVAHLFNTAYAFGSGKLLSLRANNVEKFSVDAAGLASQGTTPYVLSTRSITTASTSGLTGGGDLSANRSLAVNFGSGANQVAEGNKYLLNTYLTSRVLPDANNANATDGVAAHYLSSTSTNKPTGTDHGALTLSHSSPWAGTLAADWRTNNWYVRNKNNGTWGSWAKLWHDGNLVFGSGAGQMAEGDHIHSYSSLPIGRKTFWSQSFSATASSPAPLKVDAGVNPNKSNAYRISLFTQGTSSTTGSTWILNAPSATDDWVLKCVSKSGSASSNHPYLRVNSSGDVEVVTYHTSAYVVWAVGETIVGSTGHPTAEVFGIDSGLSYINGKIGLGTDAPASPLHLTGGTGSDQIRLSNAADTNRATIGGSTGYLNIKPSSAAWGLLVSAAGNTDYLGFAMLATGVGAIKTNSGKSISIQDNAVFINTAGNVGIGHSAPAESLDVAGKIKASTEMLVGANVVWHAGNLAFGTGSANMAPGNHTHNSLVNGITVRVDAGSTFNNYYSQIASGTAGAAHVFNTADPITHTNTNLLSVQNKGTEKFSIDKEGYITGPGATFSGQLNLTSGRLYFGNSAGALDGPYFHLDSTLSRLSMGQVAMGLFNEGVVQFPHPTDQNLRINGNAVWHEGNLAFGTGATDMAPGNHTHSHLYDTSTVRVDTSQLSSGNTYTGKPTNNSAGVGHIFNTVANLTVAGAKLLSVRNANVEKFYIDKDGNVAEGGTLLSNKYLPLSGGFMTGRLAMGLHGNNMGLNLPISYGPPSAVSGRLAGDIVWDKDGGKLYVYDGVSATYKEIGGGSGSAGFPIKDSAAVTRLDATAIGSSYYNSTAIGSTTAHIFDSLATATTLLEIKKGGAAQFKFYDSGSMDIQGGISASNGDSTFKNVTIGGKQSFTGYNGTTGLRLPTVAGVPISVAGTLSGQIAWNTTSNLLYVYGTSWLEIAQVAKTLQLTGGTVTGATTFNNRLNMAAHANNVGLRLPTKAGTPTTVTGLQVGDIVWDSTNKKLYVADTTSTFKEIGAGGGGGGSSTFPITDSSSNTRIDGPAVGSTTYTSTATGSTTHHILNGPTGTGNALQVNVNGVNRMYVAKNGYMYSSGGFGTGGSITAGGDVDIQGQYLINGVPIGGGGGASTPTTLMTLNCFDSLWYWNVKGQYEEEFFGGNPWHRTKVNLTNLNYARLSVTIDKSEWGSPVMLQVQCSPDGGSNWYPLDGYDGPYVWLEKGGPSSEYYRQGGEDFMLISDDAYIDPGFKNDNVWIRLCLVSDKDKASGFVEIGTIHVEARP